MAILSKRTAESDQAELPDPASDPDYARALELLTAFNRRFERLELEKRRLDLERYFAGREVERDTETDKMLRSRLAEMRRLPPLKPTQASAPAAPSDTIARGLAILAGEAVTPAPGFAAQIEQIDRQLAALGPAITDQTQIVATILGELTIKLAHQLLPSWNALVVQMYRDAQALSRSTSRFREYRARLIERNIRTEILRAPNVLSPLQLGAEIDPNSEITFWRRTLEDWKIL
jgi:hypothetical protein